MVGISVVGQLERQVKSVSNFENNSRNKNRPSILGHSFFLHAENTERRPTVSAESWRSFTSIRAVWRRRRARKEAACDAV